ncbi:MAG: efflux RND transporter periplasmic adaptor subunit [wastewater metagenome]|nr:efflux RND transporter periplasmic adaptor subunit [Candidatus Loosdrechtia aerotolerans]
MNEKKRTVPKKYLKKKTYMKKMICGYVFFAVLVICYNPILFAENNDQIPPVKVVVAEVVADTIAPETEFIGTVYYPQVSNVASEVSGKVDAVTFEEGERVKKGCVLVTINSDLLNKSIQTKKAIYDQIVSDLELATRDLVRIKNLYNEKIVAEQVYDEHRFKVIGLKKKSASIKAEMEGLEVEFQKKIVKVPFDGVIIKKLIEVGEWLSSGTPIATIARDDDVDIITNVPEEVLQSIDPGIPVPVRVNGSKLSGKVFTIIPQGDILTRTFPIKVRISNSSSLIAGMEARVVLPRGKRIQTLTVKRDALLTMFGKTIIFAVIDSVAKMIPVQVTGYNGIIAGIESPELEEGMQVVVKGHERLQHDQLVYIINETKLQHAKKTF